MGSPRRGELHCGAVEPRLCDALTALRRGLPFAAERVPIFYEHLPPARAARAFFSAEPSDGLLRSLGVGRNSSSRNANANTQRTKIRRKAFNIFPYSTQT